RHHRRDQPKPLGAHPHDRGPDRVSAPPQAVHRQSARDRARRNELRRRSACCSPPGPRRDPRGRDARPRDDLDRAHRCGNRPPRLRNAAYAKRPLDDRQDHRRLPGRAAGADPDSDRQLAAGRRHPGAAADGRRAGTRSCARGPLAGRRRPEPHPSGQGRADLFGDADEHEPRHADDGAVAGRSDHARRRRARSRPYAFEPARAAPRRARARRLSRRASGRCEPAARRATARRGSARRRELAMDDRSVWKKELSFGRKSKGKKDGDKSPAPGEKPTSIWKKELSFKRKPKADAVEADVAADTPVIEEPASEEPVAEEPIIGEPPAAEPEATEEPVWKKEVSFSQRISSYG